MSDEFNAPRGTLDWLPARQAARHAMIERFRALCEGAGYREAATPVFEEKALFSRTAGESSEVVGKEMYLFEDQGERMLALRPEFTAYLMRLYLGHGLSREAQPVRLWCAGSCYRYAAVQRGRYREFTQVDAEAIGSDDPAVDAELIALQLRWYAALGLDGLRKVLDEELASGQEVGKLLEAERAEARTVVGTRSCIGCVRAHVDVGRGAEEGDAGGRARRAETCDAIIGAQRKLHVQLAVEVRVVADHHLRGRG
jgi:histidyl-tRNA synthetase